MDLKTLQKFGGLSLMIGAVLFVIYTVGFMLFVPIHHAPGHASEMVQNPNWLWLAVTVFIAIILMIFGFIAIYSKIYDKAGKTGLFGFIFIVLAYLLQASKVTWEIFIYPLIVKNERSVFLFNDNVLKNSMRFTCFRTMASITILLGIILFCTAIIRSRVFSTASGLLILVGALLYGLGPLLNVYFAMTGIFIFGIGCLLLGKQMTGS